MKPRMWLPGAIVLACAAGAAQAQNTRQPFNNQNGARTPGGFFIRNPETGQQPFMQNGVVFQFIPGVGFVPNDALRGFAIPAQQGQGGAFVDPRLSAGTPLANPNFGAGFGANNFGAGAAASPFGTDPRFNASGLFGNGNPTTVSPGATIIPNNGLGGYYGGYYGPGWNGGGYAGAPNSQVVFVPVPTLPSNTPIWKYTGWRGRFKTPDEVRDRPTAASRRETEDSRTADEPEGRVYASAATRDQVRLARHAQDLMARRPMRQGSVISIGATGVMVRYSVDGEMRSYRFPTDEVFFFRPSGAMESASTAPSELDSGDSVLVPDPAGREPRVSVAGSRQSQSSAKRVPPARPRPKSAPKRARARSRSRY